MQSQSQLHQLRLRNFWGAHAGPTQKYWQNQTSSYAVPIKGTARLLMLLSWPTDGRGALFGTLASLYADSECCIGVGQSVRDRKFTFILFSSALHGHSSPKKERPRVSAALNQGGVDRRRCNARCPCREAGYWARGEVEVSS